MTKRFLLVDNDNTLMDFTLAESRALLETLAVCGLPSDAATQRLYERINRSLWQALERGDLTLNELKVARFARLMARLGVQGDAEHASEVFSARLACHAELMDGAMELIRAVHGRMKLALVSNGISFIQRGRLARCPFTPYLGAVLISEELGFAKPDPRMVEAALSALGCEDRREAVFLGDSLSADVGAASAAGIDSLWLAPAGQTSSAATQVVHSLAEAQAWLVAHSEARQAE